MPEQKPFEAWIAFSELYPKAYPNEEAEYASYVRLYDADDPKQVNVECHTEAREGDDHWNVTSETVRFKQDREEVANQLRIALEYVTGKEWVEK